MVSSPGNGGRRRGQGRRATRPRPGTWSGPRKPTAIAGRVLTGVPAPRTGLTIGGAVSRLGTVCRRGPTAKGGRPTGSRRVGPRPDGLTTAASGRATPGARRSRVGGRLQATTRDTIGRKRPRAASQVTGRTATAPAPTGRRVASRPRTGLGGSAGGPSGRRRRAGFRARRVSALPRATGGRAVVPPTTARRVGRPTSTKGHVSVTGAGASRAT